MNFTKASSELQGVFLNAFEAGFNNPDNRPDFDQWLHVLLGEIKREKECQLSSVLNLSVARQ